MLAVIRFRVGGNLRYLSHAETMRVFQRACVRARIKVAYSQGFNPHPRMSLVLPRSVGVESDDEMLCLRLEEDGAGFDADALKNEVPDGIEIFSVTMSGSKNVPGPSSARYLIKTREEHADERMKERIEELLAGDKIVVERRSGEGSRVKLVDVRPFLESINMETADIIVDCKISPAGTIRVDEMLSLLQLEVKDLARPVRRMSVQYTD
ncbi:MAG: TIGR03936 family radical SAM-associated protein [Planctomycetota bacterium]